MKKRLISALVACAMLVSITPAAIVAQPEPTKADAFIDHLKAKYDEPEIEYRPDLRWWLAEGLNTNETIIKNIQEIYDAGFGAAEFLAMPEPSAGSSIYGWGSDEWTNDSQLIIREAEKRGLGFSLTSGTHWANANLPDTYEWGGKPYNLDNKAASKELNYATVNVPAGTMYHSVLPRPVMPSQSRNATELVLQGVVAAKVITPRANAGANFAQGSGVGVLAMETIDLTDTVVLFEGEPAINWTAPADGDYVLLVYWLHGTGQTASPSVSVNYTINYMDKYGIQAMIDYWDEYIMIPEIKEIVRRSGRGEIYMDSLELSTYAAGGAFWGYDFMDEFKARREYDIVPYLPFITKAQGRVGGGRALTYDYQPPPAGENMIAKVRNDLFQTMTEMYFENVLMPLRSWLHNELNMTLRAEPSYGFTFEISTPAKYIDGIETETLAMSVDIDLYRGMSGAARIYGRPFSSETGAGGGKNYIHNMDYYTQMCYTQFAEGINRTVFHGYSGIEGSEGDTYWPGHEGMYARHSERFNSRQPAFRHYVEWNRMLARNQKVLRQGIPRMDIAILRTDFDYNCYGRSNDENRLENNFMQNDKASFWQDLSLQAAGYTYEYFAPMILEDEENINWAGGLLQPGGPGYQAVILYQEELPLASAIKILDMARSGVPVLFVNNTSEIIKSTGPVIANHGQAASRSMFLASTDAEVQAVVNQIKALPNARTLDDQADTLAALQELGVYPRVAYDAPNLNILTVSRQDDADNILYTYAYNYKWQQTSPYTVELAIDAVGKPYAIDDWTCDVEEIAVYEIRDGRTYVTLTLNPGESTIIALDLDDGGSGLHAVSTEADELLLSNGMLSVRATKSGTYGATLSDGRVVNASADVPAKIALPTWDIVVEDWNEGDKVVNLETQFGHTTREVYFTTKKTPLEFLASALMPWKDLPATSAQLASLQGANPSMSHISGVGYYSTKFHVPADWSGVDGAYLRIGSTSGGTAAVHVNGAKAPPLDLRTLAVDISGMLTPGENEITVDVATTLTNRLIQREYRTNVVSNWTLASPTVQDYGMVGEVYVEPFKDILVAAGGPTVGVGAEERTPFNDRATYVFRAEEMDAVNLVELTFEVDGDILSGQDAILAGLNGFTVFEGLKWESLGGGKWQGKAIVGVIENGQTRSGSMDVARLALDAVRLGDAKLTLTSVDVFGIDVIGGTPTSNRRFATIYPSSASTRVFSIYDIDGDGKVDLGDLSLAFYHYLARSSDANWDDAKVADVNGDGVVNMLDLVSIYANFI